MRLPFQHKEEEVTIPLNEVKKLREEGKSDREIIAILKEKGYSFQAIEKAMLQALREGVTPKPKVQLESSPPQPTQTPEYKKEEQPKLPTREELEPRRQGFLLPREAIEDVPLEAQFEPSALIEEVVEGVVEEKFEKLDTKFEFIHNEQEKFNKEIEEIKRLIGASIEKENRQIENLRKENDILREKIEDLVVKISALERAFKQFLPEIFSKAREMKLKERGIEVIEGGQKEEAGEENF